MNDSSVSVGNFIPPNHLDTFFINHHLGSFVFFRFFCGSLEFFSARWPKIGVLELH